MSKDNYDFSDLDAILAEFSDRDDAESEAYTAPAEPVYEAPQPAEPTYGAPAYAEVEPDYDDADLPEEEPAPAPYQPPEDLPPLYARGVK